ncbi:lipopolysaccharide biosynthesis protein [Mesorhizobium sp. CAU 1741]|uniref:lipopolysaccharide biosynthesis protein n=1 Tax=Mesorhizobium sp. CAU 1741 TaxID=3140366 RepID=UPI00325ABE8D
MFDSVGSDSSATAPMSNPTIGQRVKELLRRPDVRGMAVVILIKVMMVVLNFTLIALAARALDTLGFGYYSVLYSAAGLLLIVAAAGQELFVIRGWNEFFLSGDAAGLKGTFLFSFVLSAFGSLTISVVLLPVLSWSFDSQTALAVTCFMAFAAMLQISNHLLRTSIGVAAGDGLGNLLQLSPAIAYLAWSIATQADATVSMVFVSLAIGTVLALSVHLFMMHRMVARLFPNLGNTRARVDRKAWLWRSAKLWASNCLEATNQYVDVLIIGYLVSPTVAGAYFVTVRLANLFAAAADSINLFSTRHFPRLYFQESHDELSEFLDGLAWITVAFMATGMLGVAVGGYFVLDFINEDYATYFPELLVLCLGTAAVGMARPCGSILMLTGHEGRYLRIIAVSVALRVAALLALIPSFGVMGAVCATAASFLVAAAMMRREVKLLTALDPTIIRLIRRGSRTAYATPIA